jgi:FKBP-type peptidyl-prolyl cis-trans isomerase SlpA
MTTRATIAPGCRVRLHFSLALPDGTETVSTFGEEPLDFTLGDGTMTEALEEAIIGLPAGANEMIILSGDETFGPATKEMVQSIPRQDFPPEMELKQGQIISFTTPAGDDLAGTILEVDDKEAVVDFNHPFSGLAIAFRIQILEVFPEQATTNSSG